MSDISGQSPSDQEESSSTSGLGDKARQFADDVKTSAASHAEDGKAKGADRLAGVAETVDRVADQVADQSPAMAEWVRKAANELDGVSRNLKDKSVGDLLTMGKDFARREPAAFIAASAIAGFALSRLLKSSSANSPVQASVPQVPETLVSGSSSTSGMAYHPGDAVRPTAKQSSPTNAVARPDPSQGVQPADLARAGSGTQFPLDAQRPTATSDGDLAK
jgi:hypothetical protein